MSAASSHFDVAIVGGGLVGASLGLALAGTPLRVVLIEAIAHQSAAQPSFDDRTTALGNGARRMFETLGVWPEIAQFAAPIRSIHISDAGRFGFARLDAAAQGVEALGFAVSNRCIGAALWRALGRAPAITVQAPTRVTAIHGAVDSVRLSTATADGRQASVEARLVVAADGAHSLVQRQAGIDSSSTNYRQTAVIGNIRTDRAASSVAYERFTDTGPLAVLPLLDGSYTVVWTLAPEQAATLCACPEQEFMRELQRCFGWRVGRILAVAKRASYPLVLTRAAQHSTPRTVLIGNAAQALHPVAAQGFNLGLRDAAMLAESIAGSADPGAAALLTEFARRRAADRRGMIGFTDTLVKVFSDPRTAVLRDLGLLLFDLMPPAKQAMSRLSVGFGAALPRLVRGLPLAGTPPAAQPKI
jgi:2-octaprenyl-6-methoxyphenol hydroxylase